MSGSVSGFSPKIDWKVPVGKYFNAAEKNDENIAFKDGKFDKADVEGAIKSGKQDIYISDANGKVVGKMSLDDLKNTLGTVKATGEIDYSKLNNLRTKVLESNYQETKGVNVTARLIAPETVGKDKDIISILDKNCSNEVDFNTIVKNPEERSKVSKAIMEKNGFNVEKYKTDPEYREKVISAIAALMPDLKPNPDGTFTKEQKAAKFGDLLFGKKHPITEDDTEFMQSMFKHVQDAGLKEVLNMPSKPGGKSIDGVDGKFALRTATSVDCFAFALQAKIKNPISNMVLIAGKGAEKGINVESEVIALNSQEADKFRAIAKSRPHHKYSESQTPDKVSTPKELPITLDKKEATSYQFFIGGHNTDDESKRLNGSSSYVEGHYNTGTAVNYGVPEDTPATKMQESINKKMVSFMSSPGGEKYGLFQADGETKVDKDIGATTDGNYILKLPSTAELKKSGFTDDEIKYMQKNSNITFTTDRGSSGDRIYITGGVKD